jgi:hypothetical protein
MDIALVSGRARGAAPHHSRRRAELLAAALAHAGHRVRWICPVPRRSEAPEAPAGVERIAVVSRAPGFRAVLGGLADYPTERALSVALRARAADVVHVLAYGGTSSPAVAWVADRLGVPAVVFVECRELLCHRGTLVDAWGAQCAVWDDPERCTACCLQPFAGGLTPRQARRSRRWWWRKLPDWSPYPKPIDFRSRMDVLLGGFTAAASVLVATAAEREALVRAGLPAGLVEVVGSDLPRVEELVEIYARARRRGAWGATREGS